MPGCISDFKYDDYSIFVGSKHVKLTWKVTNASEAAKFKIYYYVADERTLYNGSNEKGNDSWSQLRMYAYGTRYDWQYNNPTTGTEETQTARFTHIDQGPWAKQGVTYTGMLADSPSLGDLDPDGETPKGLIGTVTSMTPLLVGRSIKWDDPTTFANGEAVVKTVSLSDGSLDLGETDGKSLCVFFIFHNEKTGDNYYGPDKQTNSTDAGKRHFSYSMLPWNGCWMSVNLCVPMPIKVSWSSTKDGAYTEVACGTDVEFPGNDVWVKLELNTDFASVSGSEDIWYNTSSLMPLQTKHTASGYDDEDTYDEYYIESKKYEGPIHLTRNTVLRYAVYQGTTLKYGQKSASGLVSLGTESFNESGAYSSLGYKISVGTYYERNWSGSNSTTVYPILPIEANLRNHYMWGNTFVKAKTKKMDLTFTKSIPNSSWLEYLTGRYGLGSGAYTYQTYVADKDLLIPSSLEGIVDFFIVLAGNEYAINTGNADQPQAGTEPYLSRINWVPKGMPVIVRYRNYSAANPMATPEEAVTNLANMKIQLTGENLGTDQERLPSYFLTKENGGAALFNWQENRGFKSANGDYEGSTASLEYPYNDPVTGEEINVLYPQKTKDGQPLYYKTDDNYNYGEPPLYQKLNENGQPLYQAVNENGEKLYFFNDCYISCNEPYQYTENGKRLWKVLDNNYYYSFYAVMNSNGEYLYYYKDGSGNPVYHQTDDSGNPLFYTYEGSEETTTDVTDYPLLQSEPGDYAIPFLGTEYASEYQGYMVDTSAKYYVLESESVPGHYSNDFYTDSDSPLLVNEDNREEYANNDSYMLVAFTTCGSEYPEYEEYGLVPYCGAENENDDYGNSTDLSYPVFTTETEMNGYTLEPGIWNSNNDYEEYKGDLLYTTEQNDYPAYDYEQGPLTRKWALTAGTDFVDIEDFNSGNVTDFKSAMEPQTFTVYDGTSDRAFWYPEYQCYHLSTCDHRDEGNFYNVLHTLDEAKSVSDVEQEHDGRVYGLTTDHTNTWIGANYDLYLNYEHWEYNHKENANAHRGYDNYGAEANTDIGLHLTAFSNKYNTVLTGNTINKAPVLDDWLVYAPIKKGYELNHDDTYNDTKYDDSNPRSDWDSKIYSFYYGYFLSDVDPNSDISSYSNESWDSRPSYACAAWKKVNSGTIQPGKAFLVWNNGSFGGPSNDGTERETSETGNAKMGMTSGTTLSGEWSRPWSAIATAVSKPKAAGRASAESLYDLQGRRVCTSRNGLQRGVYVKNGKKIVVK